MARRPSIPRWAIVGGVAALSVGLVAFALVYGLARDHGSTGGASSPHATSTPSSAWQGPADDRLIVQFPQAPQRFELLDWNGQLQRSISLGSNQGGPVTIPEPSPHGTRLITNAHVGQMVVRAVLGLDGHVYGSLDPQQPYVWADDDRHLCLVQNPFPGQGQQSTLAVSDLGQSQRMLGSLGSGDAAQDILHQAVACSVEHDVVVVVDEKTFNGPRGMQLAASSVREFRLSTFQELHRYDVTTGMVHVVASYDGAYFAETTLGTRDTRIVSMADGSTVASLPGRQMLGFSWDDKRVVTLLEDPVATKDVVEVRSLATLAVLAKETGIPAWLQFRPSSSDLAVGVTTEVGGGFGVWTAAFIVEGSGAVVQISAPIGNGVTA
jgi:hypothetical protein